MSGWRIVWSYVYKHRFVYFFGVMLVAASSLLAVWIPRLLGSFTDSLQHGSLSFSGIANFAWMIIVIGIIRVFAGWSGRILVHRHGRILTYKLRQELFLKWGTLSQAYYHRQSIGNLLSHALSDVEVVRELVTMGINVSIGGLSMLAAALYMMVIYMDWRLALAGLGPLVAIPVIIRYLGPKIRNQFLRSQAALGSMAQTVEESISGIRAVKAFGNERVSINRFEQKIDTIVQEKIKFVRLSSLFGSLVPLMAALGFIIVMGYGGFLTIKKVISLGDFIAFTLYLAMLRMPLEQFGRVLNIIQGASASLNRLSELLQVVPAVTDRQGALLNRNVRGEVKIEKLTFRYPGTERDVLTDISFTVKPGQTLGIVGSIGSGKTTLVDLLLRLYDPPEGTVFIDGEDILSYPLARLRQGIAYVPQDGFLFSTTVLENIGFSDEEPDRERAEHSARITMVYDDIKRFPEDFETEIGERGVRLSGGQKQRVAIARMIYKDAPIHILDDSLSAVDTKTERIILKNLRGIKNKTTIVISHRLSAIRHADKILVLEEGRIVGRGNHAELIKSSGLYSRLWYMQSGLTEGAESIKPVVTEEVGSLQSGLTEGIGFIQPDVTEEGDA
ncbi:MAG: ABC transporter ATP-binding protein [Candidatus Omnitrophica bacterium]|nr:ABC transporter ATP-binding protein [Candidatus Omnitrophota bacterium]